MKPENISYDGMANEMITWPTNWLGAECLEGKWHYFRDIRSFMEL